MLFRSVLAYINIKHPGAGFDLTGKIKATNFVQKKSEEHKKSDLIAQPVVKLATADNFSLSKAKEEKLSQIIAEINSRTGKSYNKDVAVKSMLQIRDILLKSEKLKVSAKNNNEKDFEFSYFDNIDNALIEGLDQNQDFFSLLLNNSEIKREVLGVFADEIYRSLRQQNKFCEIVFAGFSKKEMEKLQQFTEQVNRNIKEYTNRDRKSVV